MSNHHLQRVTVCLSYTGEAHVTLLRKGTLMPSYYGPVYEKKRQKERELERELLLHLRAVNGPVNWKALCVQFDLHRTGDIAPLLHALKEGRYIAVDEKNNITITKLGLKRLEAGMF